MIHEGSKNDLADLIEPVTVRFEAVNPTIYRTCVRRLNRGAASNAASPKKANCKGFVCEVLFELKLIHFVGTQITIGHFCMYTNY